MSVFASALVLLLSSLAGFSDAAYLTWEHYAPDRVVPCADLPFVDCGAVLNSPYAMIFGIPLALIGAVFYAVLAISVLWYMARPRRALLAWLFVMTLAGFGASLVFVWLQAAVIRAICPYCMISAAISVFNFFWIRAVRFEEYRLYLLRIAGIVYRRLIKPVLFSIDPELVHHVMTRIGELIGRLGVLKPLERLFIGRRYPELETVVAGITFPGVVGLAAGFDYEARLTQTLDPLGFGFQTVGTISARPCEGNQKPRLGRLPKSKALLVNKGFRNPGARAVVKKLKKLSFSIPVGISLGVTNSPKITTLEEAIADIQEAFTTFERSKVQHAYYELNISCPNLQVEVSFYEPEHLRQLLSMVEALGLKRPFFIKMPIELDNERFIKLLDIISESQAAGIIVGNLQKNRKEAAFCKEEVRRCGKGNFSGQPTARRSNELIKLAYTHTGGRLTIIGCGGIFSAEDAYTKIALGASMVQLITGMIFEGPQLVAEINAGIAARLRADGFLYICEAVGSKVRR